MEPQQRQPWNKGKLVGQKAPLKLRDIWAIRIRLQLRNRTRDLALFNLAIDSKLRACDLVKLRVLDVAHGGEMGGLNDVLDDFRKGDVSSSTNASALMSTRALHVTVLPVMNCNASARR